MNIAQNHSPALDFGRLGLLRLVVLEFLDLQALQDDRLVPVKDNLGVRFTENGSGRTM
jgi:hypothetical protein